MNTNPFQPPSHSDSGEFFRSGDVNSPSALSLWILRFLWSYPLLLLTLIHTTWLVAWVQLGHAPRPSLDDPKSISLLVSSFYLAALIALMGFPAAAVGGLGFQLITGGRSWALRVMLTIVLALIWMATILFMRSNFGHVGEWFMD